MLPTPIISALTLARLDIGHRLGLDRQIPIGAAILTARMQGTSVCFSLDSRILQPSEMTGTLLSWLEQHLTREGVTIVGYDLDDVIALLGRLPDAQWSPGLRALTGRAQQWAISLSAFDDAGPLTFREACADWQTLCAPADPNGRFAAWVQGEVRDIEHHAQVDAIAIFRLFLIRLAVLGPMGRTLSDAIKGHFYAWLEAADHPAARAHIADRSSVAD